MATKNKSEGKASQDFEGALERLGEINEKLEGGEVSLDEAIKLYTDGMKMAKLCQDKLAVAEQQIKLLVEKGGALAEEDFGE